VHEPRRFDERVAVTSTTSSAPSRAPSGASGAGARTAIPSATVFRLCVFDRALRAPRIRHRRRTGAPISLLEAVEEKPLEPDQVNGEHVERAIRIGLDQVAGVAREHEARAREERRSTGRLGRVPARLPRVPGLERIVPRHPRVLEAADENIVLRDPFA
jgi:hypothetical protein